MSYETLRHIVIGFLIAVTIYAISMLGTAAAGGVYPPDNKTPPAPTVHR